MRTAYANAYYQPYFSFGNEHKASACTDQYTNCTQDDNGRSQCNATLTGQNYKEYALSSPFPRNCSGRIILNCSACALETFPNEILDSGMRWEVLNFSSSHITYLKMNDLNASIANNIRQLHFNNNSITHLDAESLPTSVGIFELDLSHNLIGNVTGNGTFSKMRRLSTLNLAYNQLAHLDALIFKDLRSLRTLNLNNNRLLEASFICQLSSSMEVTLSNNPIVSFGTNAAVKKPLNSAAINCSISTNVKMLDISNGSFETIDLSKAYDIKFLYLSSNHLKSFVFKFGKLQELDLNDNKLEAINLANADALHFLNLARNNITNMLNISLPKGLKKLDLSHNKIANLAEGTFKNLSRLRYLNLAHCGMHTLNAGTFIPTSVIELDLSHNILVKMDLNLFNGFGGLERLNLNGNRLTDINIEDLKHPAQLGISDNDWNCTRLPVIIDVLSRRSGIAFFTPCNPLTCKRNVHGIACGSVDYNVTTDASTESNEEDEGYGEIKVTYRKGQYAMKIVQEINQDLQYVLMDIRRQRTFENPENDADIVAQNFNQTITERFRSIFNGLERLREIADGLVMEINNATDEITSITADNSSQEDILTTTTMRIQVKDLNGPDTTQSYTVAIALIVMVMVAAAIYISANNLRIRGFQAVCYRAYFNDKD